MLSVNTERPLMRFFSITCLSILALVSVTLFSCSTEKEEFKTDALNDYMPLVVGKYITYRLDSLVFKQFGRVTETHEYQVKHQVDAEITDNTGQKSYRIHRYIRDAAGTLPWEVQIEGTFFITPKADQVEVIEDNLRFIKLHLPFKDGFSWKGNKYLPDDPYSPAGYNFSNDNDMEDWDFNYDHFAAQFTYKNINYTDVYTVEQVDESLNVPITIPTAYASKSRGIEKYSKNIGLVYREYELWEYQPNTGGSGGPYKNGFGITMWMIDHN